VQGCLPPLLRALSDKPPVLEASDQTSESNEEAALGACTALCGRMLCRFTTRNTQVIVATQCSLNVNRKSPMLCRFTTLNTQVILATPPLLNIPLV
jgi:hypothetical protein